MSKKEIKCLRSKDGYMYCIRDREKKRFMEGIELLDAVNKKMMKLIVHLKKKYPNKSKPASQSNIARLIKGFSSSSLREILPCSDHVAYVTNKGEKLAVCRQKEKHESKFIEMNTLMYVLLHEISHIASKSIGHTTEFRDNFSLFLKESVAAGIYYPEDYSKSHVRYCGMTISNNLYFDDILK